ncbi:hypothetical protein O0L34_g17595 [Tuta absoluta]|nr:hypothetical protein O0L34_g17595 [Tuta absoluta]
MFSTREVTVHAIVTLLFLTVTSGKDLRELEVDTNVNYIELNGEIDPVGNYQHLEGEKVKIAQPKSAETTRETGNEKSKDVITKDIENVKVVASVNDQKSKLIDEFNGEIIEDFMTQPQAEMAPLFVRHKHHHRRLPPPDFIKDMYNKKTTKKRSNK